MSFQDTQSTTTSMSSCSALNLDAKSAHHWVVCLPYWAVIMVTVTFSPAAAGASVSAALVVSAVGAAVVAVEPEEPQAARARTMVRTSSRETSFFIWFSPPSFSAFAQTRYTAGLLCTNKLYQLSQQCQMIFCSFLAFLPIHAQVCKITTIMQHCFCAIFTSFFPCYRPISMV